jgi:hypothetical protein
MAGANKQAIAAYKAYLDADSAGKFAITANRRIKTLQAQTKTTEPPPKKVEPQPKPKRAAVTPAAVSTDQTPTVKKKKKNKMLWLIAGAAVIAAGVAADVVPESGSNGSLDGMDLVPVGLYGIGITAVIIGVF